MNLRKDTKPSWTHIIERESTYPVAMSVYVMCSVQNTVEIIDNVSPYPNSNSLKLDPDNRYKPINMNQSLICEGERGHEPMREMLTAIHVDNFGFPFLLNDGINNEKIGVKNKSKPAINAHFEAEVNVIANLRGFE